MDYHLDEPVITKGNLLTAETAVIMLHGRGSSADNILGLSGMLDATDVYFIAPQATDAQWYPQPFTQPLSQNQPQLDFALRRIDSLVNDLKQQITIEKIFLLGFSQGACLSLEYAVRNPNRINGVMALSGGLIGEDAEVRNHNVDLSATKFYLSCSRQDPYIPESRLMLTVKKLQQLNANLVTNLYDLPGHSVVDSDVGYLKNFLD